MTRRLDHGVATVWAVCWMAVCLTVAWLALVVTTAVAAQHRLDAAADLAALSAAARLQHGGDACRAAAGVADASHVRLRRCVVRGEDVVVAVVLNLDLPLGLHREAVSEARAGPS